MKKSSRPGRKNTRAAGSDRSGRSENPRGNSRGGSGSRSDKPSFRREENKDERGFRGGSRNSNPGAERRASGDRPSEGFNSSRGPEDRRSDRPSSDRGSFRDKPEGRSTEGRGDRPSRYNSDRPSSDRGSFRDKPEGRSTEGRGDRPSRYNSDRPSSDRGSFRDKPEGRSTEGRGDRPSRYNSDRPSSDRGGYRDKPEGRSTEGRGDRPTRYNSDRPSSDRGGYRDKPEGRSAEGRGDGTRDNARPGERPLRGGYSPESRESSNRSGDGSTRGRSNDTRPDRGDRKDNRNTSDRPDRDTRNDQGERRPYNAGYYSNPPKRRPRVKSEEGAPIETEIRLNRYISMAGICSRREADDLIKAGVIMVNGVVITELGTKVNVNDEIRYNGERIRNEKNVYVLLNKPKDYITTSNDPEGRKTVMDLVADACPERIYPVGRLDRNTTGLLLFTNDGDLARYLTHPSSRIRKMYSVELDRNFKVGDMEKIREGLELEDGKVEVDSIDYDDESMDKKKVGVELHSGKNRIVRRMFEHLGYEVVKLDRVIFAGLTKKDLPRGRFRMLSDSEMNLLKQSTGAGKKKIKVQGDFDPED